MLTSCHIVIDCLGKCQACQAHGRACNANLEDADCSNCKADGLFCSGIFPTDEQRLGAIWPVTGDSARENVSFVMKRACLVRLLRPASVMGVGSKVRDALVAPPIQNWWILQENTNPAHIVASLTAPPQTFWITLRDAKESYDWEQQESSYEQARSLLHASSSNSPRRLFHGR